MITYRVPGRINLIGEHTDYNLGLVLPAAIQLGLTFSISLSSNDRHFFYSGLYDDSAHISRDGKLFDKPWARYFSKVIQLFHTNFNLTSCIECHFDGDLPIGAGLSSSSALACGLIYGINALLDLGLSDIEMVRWASRAENSTGLQGGMMDQFSIIHGQKDHFLLIDCRDMSYSLVQFALEGFELVLIDSRVEHSLVETGYNDRRLDCEQGLNTLTKTYIGLKSVRDITIEQLQGSKNGLTEVQEKRLRFVIEENARVRAMQKALLRKDALSIGQLLYASHEGLRDLYEVSCTELDYIVDWTRSQRDILGSRMMGGGFGGCSILLVKTGAIHDIMPNLYLMYEEKFGKRLNYYPICLSDGIHRVTKVSD